MWAFSSWACSYLLFHSAFGSQGHGGHGSVVLLQEVVIKVGVSGLGVRFASPGLCSHFGFLAHYSSSGLIAMLTVSVCVCVGEGEKGKVFVLVFVFWLLMLV